MVHENRENPHEEAISILLDARESVYSYEIMDIELPEKPEKSITLCDNVARVLSGKTVGLYV